MHYILDYFLVPIWLIASFYYVIKKIFFTKYKKPSIISIDGNIGSGKSTLIEYLKKNCKDNKNITFLEEPVNKWINTVDDNNKNVLEMFYEDKNRIKAFIKFCKIS